MPDVRAGAPGGGRKPVDQTRSAEGEERWAEGGVGDAWWICNRCGAAWNDDGRDHCFDCGLTYRESHAWRVVRASRFEEVQTEYREKLARADQHWDERLQRAEAERDVLKAELAEALEGKTLLGQRAPLGRSLPALADVRERGEG